MIAKEARENPHIVRWSQDGRAFFIDDEEAFIRDVSILCRRPATVSPQCYFPRAPFPSCGIQVLPRYSFKASKMQSFQRNLNIYGTYANPTGMNTWRSILSRRNSARGRGGVTKLPR